MNKKISFKLNTLFTVMILLSAQNIFAANFNIAPLGTLPTTVATGQSIAANYTVTNMTSTARNGYVLQGLPATVTQNTTSPNCGNPINLGPHASCQLQLDITGAVSANVAICKGNSCTMATTPLSVLSVPATCAGPDGACRVFLTDTTTRGNISGATDLSGPAAPVCSGGQYTGNPFAVANCICNFEANAVRAIPGVPFKVWLSTSSVLAPTNISYNANLTYISIMTNGDIIATPDHPLLAGTLLSPIVTNAPPSQVAYTGTTATGTLQAAPGEYSCSDWTNSSATTGRGSGGVGRQNETSSDWSLLANVSCNEPHPLYCFETP